MTWGKINVQLCRWGMQATVTHVCGLLLREPHACLIQKQTKEICVTTCMFPGTTNDNEHYSRWTDLILTFQKHKL